VSPLAIERLPSGSSLDSWRTQVKKVLIVEDDVMTADTVEDALIQSGYDVCGKARTVDDAVALGQRHQPDLVVLDLRLAKGGFGTQVAAHLLSRSRVGVLYATANMTQFKLDTDDGEALLVKPYTSADLLRSLEIVSDIVTTGRASPPFPRGFHVLPVPIADDPALSQQRVP
jgi:CheY-like chemotaxis protein